MIGLDEAFYAFFNCLHHSDHVCGTLQARAEQGDEESGTPQSSPPIENPNRSK